MDQRSHTFQVNKQFPLGWFPLFASPRHYCRVFVSQTAVQTLFVLKPLLQARGCEVHFASRAG